MKNLTWQNPEQLFVAQVLINKVKSKCCGIKGMEKYSLEAKELLSESQMFEVKAGAVVKDHLQQECSLCDSCIGCASACAVCVNDVL